MGNREKNHMEKTLVVHMSKCNYCHEEMPMPSRHEPNCNLNPYFQNRLSKGWRAMNGIDEI